MAEGATAPGPPGTADAFTEEFARLLAENDRFAEVYDRTRLTAAPLTGLALVTCMDTRLTIDEALGLRPGDAHLIRNAGGVVTNDVIRSLIVSQQRLGTDEILVVMHTGCGLLGLDERELRERMAASLGVMADDVAIEFGAFDDVSTAVREQVGILRTHQLIRRVPVHGAVFDVATGRLHVVI